MKKGLQQSINLLESQMWSQRTKGTIIKGGVKEVIF